MPKVKKSLMGRLNNFASLSLGNSSQSSEKNKKQQKAIITNGIDKNKLHQTTCNSTLNNIKTKTNEDTIHHQCNKLQENHNQNGNHLTEINLNLDEEQEHKDLDSDLDKKKHVSKESLDGLDQEGKNDFLLPEEQCDLPTFLHTKCCDLKLIDETRLLLKERFAKNPDSFYDHDFKRMLEDDWTVSRFLLRRRLDPKRAAKLMEECGRFRKQYKMSEVKLYEFPIEFHKAGGLFKYAPDRVGNITVYMRVKMYRRVPEISDVFKAFILCVLEEADVANNGRGFAVVFDLTGCGLKNVDLSFLSWLLSSFRNYCPKGVSYIVVYNLPWILNATCKLAMSWMSASNRRALRFVHGKEIENFIAPENLPDYCGGTCKINYREVPKGAKPATEVCGRLDMTKKQALKIRELFKEYLSDDEEEEEEEDDDDDNYQDDDDTDDDLNFSSSTSSSSSSSSSENYYSDYDDIDENNGVDKTKTS